MMGTRRRSYRKPKKVPPTEDSRYPEYDLIRVSLLLEVIDFTEKYRKLLEDQPRDKKDRPSGENAAENLSSRPKDRLQADESLSGGTEQ